MPNFDGTGPEGQGPTGLRRGKCAAAQAGAGRGAGMGRGFGRRAANLSLEEEEKMLKERLEAVQKAQK